jgi:hypothetical protein
MYDVRKPGVLARDALHCLAIRDVCRNKAEPRPVLKMRKPVTLELDRVISVQVVDADHPITARKQGLGHVIADEPGHTGQQNLH